MITCKKCNTQLEEGVRFCYNCGNEVTETKCCKQCGKPIKDNDIFCQHCGTPIVDQESEPVQAFGAVPISEPIPIVTPTSFPNPIPTPIPTPVFEPSPTSGPIPIPAPGPIPAAYPIPRPGAAPVPVPPPYPTQMNPTDVNKAKKPGIKLPYILIAAAALVAVVLLAVLVPKVIANFRSNPQGLVYLKDDEINYTSLSKIDPKVISDSLYEDGDIEAGDAYQLTNYITFSDDGKIMFYPDKVSDSDEGLTIYYRNITSKKSEGEKIDSDIMSYETNKEGSKIYYIKGFDRNLYLSNLTDKDKIDSDVSAFYLDDTGNKILYINLEGTIYSKDGKNEKEKIDSNASIEYVSDDLETIYYIKDGSLYMKSGDKEKDKIASDVSDVVKIYETGEVYYLQSEDAEMKLSDFVNDDLKESDATMVAPVEPTYPDYYAYQPDTQYPVEPYYYEYSDYWGYTDWDAYDAAYNDYLAAVDEYNQQWEDAYNEAINTYNNEYTAYQDAYNEYLTKQDRDYLRETFADETISVTNYSLFYYDTKETKLLTDSYNTYLDYSIDKPVLVYENNNKAEYTRINMSEVNSYDDVYNLASKATSSTTEVQVAVNSNTSVLKEDNSSVYVVNDSGNTLYFLNNYDEEKGCGDLSEAKINGTKVEDPSKYESDVYSFQLIGSKDTLVYYKDVKDTSGDLYFNKKLVDSDAYTYSVNEVSGTNSFTYYVDFDYDDSVGTLKIYNGKDSTEIGDDVHSYYTLDDKKIVYLTNFSNNKQEGDAYLYKGSNKKELIDQDVTALVPIYSSKYRGSINYGFDY